MKHLVLMLYAGVDSTFGISPEIIEKLLNSYSRRKEKINYSIILNACLEKEANYFPQNKPNRRDLLRKCQSRSGYCKGTRMHCENGANKVTNQRNRENSRVRKSYQEKIIERTLSVEIRNKTYNKRHHYYRPHYSNEQ
jgi:hypothetical protein